VLIQSAYFIPNRSWRRALVGAAGRGCDVRVMVPRHSDVPGIRWASQYTWTRLLRGGVRILEFLPTMLHAKTVLVDDEWAAIGSYNLDQRSLSYNLEVALAIVDRAVCAALRERFEADARESQEIDRDLWEKRGAFQRLKEKLVYFFRLWL
jgi:cardiolipin synthase